MNRINYTQDAVQKYEALSKKLTEAMMAALKSAHSAAAPGSMDPEDLNRQRIGQDVLGRLITPPIGFGWEPFTQDDIPMAWVRPERSHDKRRAILYCHGGGYTSGNLGYARVLAAKLASTTGYEVLSFQYRLSPEYPYPAALKDARATWDFLMRQGWGARDIILAGDSAGGNLALELILSPGGKALPARPAASLLPLDGYDRLRPLLSGVRKNGSHPDLRLYPRGAQRLCA